MPELPDVEVLRRYVEATSLHRRIEDLLLRENLVEGVTPQTIRNHLRGSRLDDTRRHGKHLFLHSSQDGWLRLHFGMTGTLDAFSRGEPPDHTELLLDFEDGSHLAYVNQRKLGAISWVRDVDVFVRDRRLGPDPLTDSLDPERFTERVASRRGSLKGRLMDQEVLAGLGNVYVDEILFQAGIHPASETAAITREDLTSLYQAMHHVLEEAIERGADPARFPDDWLLPHRQPDAPCPRCGERIERSHIGGRATYSCRDHQDRIA